MFYIRISDGIERVCEVDCIEIDGRVSYKWMSDGYELTLYNEENKLVILLYVILEVRSGEEVLHVTYTDNTLFVNVEVVSSPFYGDY